MLFHVLIIFVLHAVQTLALSYLVGGIASTYETRAVVVATGITAVSIVVLEHSQKNI